MYERLRSFYNSFRPADALPVPPFDEWHGVGAFCNYFYCRYVLQLSLPIADRVESTVWENRHVARLS